MRQPGRKNLSFDIPEDLWQRIANVAHEEDRPMAWVARTALRRFLEAREVHQ